MGVLVAGVVLAGCRIEETVGRGGMGVVYRARQLDLDRVVALKVIAPEHVEDPAARARFLGEARAAAAVEHPHVVPVYGAGVQDGHAYLVMRYIPGEDLRAHVRVEGPLGVERAGALTLALGEALDAIHRAGYVHRDVKPGNVLIDPSGHVYLSDFGLAKHALATTGPTRSDHWVGTVDFAAPEQIRGEAVDARADVYALGGVLFYMLTGHVPFERDNDPAKLWAHLADDPRPPSALRPGLPAWLDDAVLRALSKDPEERMPSAGDLGRAALGRPASGERAVARGAAAPAGSAGRRALAPESGTVTRARGRATRRRRLVPAALALAAAAGLAGVLALGDCGGGERDTPGSAKKPAAAAPQSHAPRVADVIRGVGRDPRAVAVAGGDVWVLSFSRDRLDRIDARTRQPERPRPRIARGGWNMAADRTTVWVANPSHDAVQRIDAATGRVTTPIRHPPAPPVDVVATRRGLWVTGRAIPLDQRTAAPGTPDLLMRYDRSGRLSDTIEVPAGIRDVAAGGGFVWVSLLDVPRIQQRSRDGRRLRRRPIPLADKANTMSYGGGYLWASLPEHDSVARIDPRTWSHPITSDVGGKPAGLAVVGDRVFVASNTDHRVVLIDVATGEASGDGPLKVAPNPYAVTAGAGSVWVSSADGTLTRIDP